MSKQINLEKNDCGGFLEVWLDGLGVQLVPKIPRPRGRRSPEPWSLEQANQTNRLLVWTMPKLQAVKTIHVIVR